MRASYGKKEVKNIHLIPQDQIVSKASIRGGGGGGETNNENIGRGGGKHILWFCPTIILAT